jgi:hypothetical protein
MTKTTTRPAAGSPNTGIPATEVLRHNIVQLIKTEGSGITVKRCRVNGIETAVAFAVLRRQVAEGEYSNERSEALAALFVHAAEGMEFEVLPDEGELIVQQNLISEREMITTFDTEGNA